MIEAKLYSSTKKNNLEYKNLGNSLFHNAFDVLFPKVNKKLLLVYLEGERNRIRKGCERK